ncbi:MAG TPA: hypothetical protein EYP24_03040 [bacterium (Candidatus Stahlbacteria)]|nr:hypothetical protein [Candidatus Stahlbacteria bacterium]
MTTERQIIFLLLAIGVTIPFLVPMRLKINVTPPVYSLYRVIDRTRPDQAVILSFDFAPSTAPELMPMGAAILRHCLARRIKVIITSLAIQGPGLAEIALDEVSSEYPQAEYGKDYAFLGYVPGYSAVVLKMGDAITKVYEKDYYGQKTDALAIFKTIKNFDNINTVVVLTGSALYQTWIIYGYIRYGVKVGAGVTAVEAAATYPYLQTGQLVGLLGGLKGAAEYETILEEKGIYQERKRATIGMDSQSIAHLLMIVLIIIGNIIYWRMRRR